MKDSYGRVVDYLRISVTDRCNLRCVYCMPKEGISLCPMEELLTFEELLLICRLAVPLGIRHFKVTGGEPLVRKGVVGFVKALKEMEGVETVTMTTNGILLPDYMEELAACGIDGINISLDTLEPEKFRKITRNGSVDAVLKGIQSVLGYSRIGVKLNCVLSGLDWKNDAVSLAEIARQYPVHVRFIEQMPFGNLEEKGVSEQSVRTVLEAAYGKMMLYKGNIGFGPSTYYTIEGFQGKLGFISAVSHKFCDQCNRLRLTCKGVLRLCLQSEDGLDLKTSIRQGASHENIQEQMRKGLKGKPKEHRFEHNGIEGEAMSRIGG